MEKEEKKLFTSIKRATILSGIGMGLLLGLIMGLSVSEVVKVIMGTLTALLGAFMGFDKRSFAGMTEEEYLKEKQTSLFTALRAGWFGLAVVAGILFGMWIRTNEVFTVSVARSVKQWTDAGYDSAYARKLVTFQRLAINPNTGELGATTEVQRGHQSNLFSAEQVESLCGTIDPDRWNNDWKTAKEKMMELKIEPLTSMLAVIEMNIPENQRFDFLYGLRYLVCSLKENKNTNFCQSGTDLSKWQNNEVTSRIAVEVAKLPAENQKKIMEALNNLVCQLEKD
jgi:uncharacterized membrane protein (Fun14 family)